MIGKGFYGTACGEFAPLKLAIGPTWNCACDFFLSSMIGFVRTSHGKSN